MQSCVHVSSPVELFRHISILILLILSCTLLDFLAAIFFGEYVTWTFSPNNNGIAHQGRAG